MNHLHSTTAEHRKCKHLSYEERVLIQTRLKDGWDPNRIAREIGCAPNTVRNEIKRGTVALYRGKVFRYKARAKYSVIRQAPGRLPTKKIVQPVAAIMISLKKAPLSPMQENTSLRTDGRWMSVFTVL